MTSHDRGPFYRGTTIKALELNVSTPVLNVCSQIRDKYDRLVHQYAAVHDDHVIILEELPPSVTAGFPVGTLYYDVKVTFQDGTTDILLPGSTITMEVEVSRC